MVRKTTITLMILMPLFVHLGCGLQSSAIEPAADNVKSDKRGRRDPAELATQPSAFPASQPAGRPSPTRGWPNWLGPNYDGISHENDWSSDWPEAGLPIAWSRQDIGIGFSSVSIANGQLFTMGHVDGKEYVYCLHHNTGKTIWSYSYDCRLVDNLHEGGPGATPTIDGRFVYTVGREGQLFCFHASNGKIVWGKMMQDDLNVELAEWGFTCSPYILGNQLIVQGGRVVSYEKLTGKKLWETEPHNAGYGSAISFSRQGKTLLATLDCDGLRILNSGDGSQIAFEPWSSPFFTNSTTPIVVDDTIFISTGYQVGCGLFRLSDEKLHDGQLEEVYVNREMRNHFNNSILLDGYLYGFDGNSNLGRVVQLTCMKYDTGEVAWKKSGFGCGSLMIADGKLLILSDDGTLVLARATPEQYEELARSPFLEGRCWTIPVLLNGHIYGRNAAGQLTCVKLPQKSQPR